jgi:hypothetical protein
MKRRCTKSTDKNYKYYGGRGIKVCEDWMNSFEKFDKDMSPKPDGSSLDRIDNNGDYSLENCKWSSRHDQSTNMRNNKFFTFNGRTLTLSDWGRLLNIKTTTLYGRIHSYGWSLEKTLTTPIKF